MKKFLASAFVVFAVGCDYIVGKMGKAWNKIDRWIERNLL